MSLDAMEQVAGGPAHFDPTRFYGFGYTSRQDSRSVVPPEYLALDGEAPLGEEVATYLSAVAAERADSMEAQVAALQNEFPGVRFVDGWPAYAHKQVGLRTGKYIVLTTRPELYFGIAVTQGEQRVRVAPFELDPKGSGVQVRTTAIDGSEMTGEELPELSDPVTRLHANMRAIFGVGTAQSDSPMFSVTVPEQPYSDVQAVLHFSGKDAVPQVIGVVKIEYTEAEELQARPELVTRTAIAELAPSASDSAASRINQISYADDGTGYSRDFSEVYIPEAMPTPTDSVELSDGQHVDIPPQPLDVFEEGGVHQELIAVMMSEGYSFGSIISVRAGDHGTPLYIFGRLEEPSALEPNAQPAFRAIRVLSEGAWHRIAEASNDDQGVAVTDIFPTRDMIRLNHGGYGSTKVRTDGEVLENLRNIGLGWQLPVQEIAHLIADVIAVRNLTENQAA